MKIERIKHMLMAICLGCAGPLKVLAQPVITNQPASQTVLFGSNVTFSVAVSYTGPLAYQWRLNGTNLPAAITTVAGTGEGGYSGDGGPATNASLSYPQGVAVDATGNLFITDAAYIGQRVRKVTANGIISTVAGGGTGSGNGGPATLAALAFPGGLAVDGLGNLFVDDFSHRVFRVDTRGIITVVAGNGLVGTSSPVNGGAATNAALYGPSGLAVDGLGNLRVADPGLDVIVEVAFATGPTLVVNDAGFTSAGNYDVVVSSAFGSMTSSVAVLTVHGPPEITEQPTSQTVVLGGSAIFSVSALSDTPLSYQWYFDGVVLAGQTNSAVAFANVQFTDAGTYEVVITNLTGSVTSSLAVLQVRSAQTTVTYAGTQFDLVHWRLNTTLKPLDIDGDNVLGTDGYNMVNLSPVLPSYVATAAILTGTYGDSSYASIDKPTAPQTVFLTGAMDPLVGLGANAAFYSFTLNSKAAGRTIRVSLMVDNLDIAADNAISLELIQTNGFLAESGPVATTSASYNDLIPDWVFFDIKNAAAGDGFIIQGTGGTNAFASLGGVAFDSVLTAPLLNPTLNNRTNLTLGFEGAAGQTYILEATTSLAPPINWQPVFTNNADANGNWSFTNSTLSAQPALFYRVALP